MTSSTPKQSRVQVSAITGMKVGYIRKLMNIIRKQSDLTGECKSDFRITPKYTAGQFAVDYLLGNYERRHGRQSQKTRRVVMASNTVEPVSSILKRKSFAMGNDPRVEEPKSQHLS
jgi:hypothetical protein